MKLFNQAAIIALILSFSANLAFAESKCGSLGVAYQPQHGNITDALKNAFEPELEIFADNCLVQEKLKLSEKQYMHITGYNKDVEAGTETLKYDLIDFTDAKKPVEKTCTFKLVKTLDNNSGNGGPVEAIARFKSSAQDPTCVSKDNPHNYVCVKYIDCMPTIGGPTDKVNYCTNDYRKWAKANCAVQPFEVQ